MWSLRTEDFQLDPPAAATAARARVYKFFRSDLFEGLKTGAGSRRGRRGACCLPHGCQSQLKRGVNLGWFVCGCLGSLAQQMAPWLLGALDAATHLALYLCLVPNTLVAHLLHSVPYHHSFRTSVEDVMAVALARVAAVSLASCMGFDRFQRPYLFAAGGCALVGIPFLITKAAIFKYHGRWWWDVTMFVLSLVFSLAHVLCSMRVVELAQRRFSQGMLGFSVRAWEEGEEAWLTANAAGRPSPLADSEWGWQTAWKGDVSPEALADGDSRFIKIDQLTVHFKVAEPQGGGGLRHTGVVLVHGFGGGVFSWRHIMQPLADHTGCRVVAFDRPAFGLTSRPEKPSSGGLNPYESKSQARLLLQLCSALQLRRVVLVGHADGALVCLLAAAASSRGAAEGALGGGGGGGATAFDAALEAEEQGSEAPGASGSSGPSTPTPASCLSSLRSCGGGQPAPRPRLGSGAKAGLSVPTLRPARSADLCVDAEPGGSGRDEGGGGGGGAGRDPKAGSDPGMPSAPPSPPLMQGLHSISVVAMALLHPCLEGECKPQFMRLLGNTRLGRRIMRPLLRTEIGEIANRRSWFNEDKLTREVLDLYKRPLCVHGWDKALMRVSKLKLEVGPPELAALFADARGLPSMVIGGLQDSVLPSRKVEAIAEALPRSHLSLLPACGHLAHEECPAELLRLLEPFVAEACHSHSLPTMVEGTSSATSSTSLL